MDAWQTNGANDAPQDGRQTLLERYDAVRRRIASAAAAAGRDPRAVSLVAVSKTFPAEQVATLCLAGQESFAESYVQEAVDKIGAVARLLSAAAHPTTAAARALGSAGPRPEWHFIGPVQSNKTRLVAEHFDWVQSVDREKIAARLSEQRPSGLPPINVLVQVNLSGEPTKSGCTPAQAASLVWRVVRMPNLRLRGLMAIPQPTDDHAAQRAAAAQLRRLWQTMRDDGLVLDTLSIGMSADLEAAVTEGSTMVRIGTAIFGAR